MAGNVTVDEQIYAKHGIKWVMGDTDVTVIPRGVAHEPSALILAQEGEPWFEFRLTDAVQRDEDVPDEVGLALRKAGERFLDMQPDGRMAPDEDGTVEWTEGPTVHEGLIVMRFDTDDSCSGRPMIEAMVKIFVEELSSLDTPIHLTALSDVGDGLGPSWQSSAERAAGTA